MAPALPKKDKNPDSLKFVSACYIFLIMAVTKIRIREFQALSFFSSDKAIHFDALYPVYVPSDERVSV